MKPFRRTRRRRRLRLPALRFHLASPTRKPGPTLNNENAVDAGNDNEANKPYHLSGSLTIAGAKRDPSSPFTWPGESWRVSIMPPFRVRAPNVVSLFRLLNRKFNGETSSGYKKPAIPIIEIIHSHPRPPLQLTPYPNLYEQTHPSNTEQCTTSLSLSSSPPPAPSSPRPPRWALVR